MESCKYTEFGLCVKTELLKRGLKQKWLIDELRKRDMYADSGYLYKIFTGKREAPKVVDAIRDILEMPSEE